MTSTATDQAAVNREALRRGYEAFQSGNLDLLRNELFDPDIVWHNPGHNQFSGDLKGVDAVIDSFVKQFEITGGTFKVDVHDLLASDDHAVAIATVSGERDGRRISDMYTHVCHFRDGKLIEAWIVDFDPAMVDALFA